MDVFFIEDKELLKKDNIGIKSAIVWKKNFIANLSTIKTWEKNIL